MCDQNSHRWRYMLWAGTLASGSIIRRRYMKQVTMRHRSKRAEARQNASQKCRYVHNFTREYSVSPKTPTPKKKINTYLRTISTSLLDFQFNSGQPKDLGPARPQAIFISSSEPYVQLFDPRHAQNKPDLGYCARFAGEKCPSSSAAAAGHWLWFGV